MSVIYIYIYIYIYIICVGLISTHDVMVSENIVETYVRILVDDNGML